MNVSEAVTSRFSTRAFLDTAVDEETISRILDKARWAPSGGNLQPWRVHVLTGDVLSDFKALVVERSKKQPWGEKSEYDVYPPGLPEPFRSRRYQCGIDLYASLGIALEDKETRAKQFAKNFEFFGAPVALFFTIERFMNSNQWAHVGMFMQTIMLLAREEGLYTCPQEAWSAWHGAIAGFLNIPEDQMLYCGMAMGHADLAHPVNCWRTERAPLEDIAHFHGFDG
jgi:nitroreductase